MQPRTWVMVSFVAAMAALASADEKTAPNAQDGLVAYYTFDGSAADKSGNHHDGKLIGQPQFVAGRGGKCLKLDGNTWVETGIPQRELSDTFTVECWLKPAERQHGWAGIIGTEPRTGEGFVLGQRADLDNQITANCGVGSPEYIHTEPPTPLAPDVWQHLAMVKLPDGVRLYVNGILANAAPDTRRPADSPQTLLIGKGGTNIPPFAGLIREVRVWRKAITSFKHAGISLSDLLSAQAAGVRVELRAKPAGRPPLGQPVEIDMGLGQGTSSLLPADVAEIPVAVNLQRNDFQGAVREPPTTATASLKRADNFKTVFVPPANLPPGFYVLTCRTQWKIREQAIAGPESSLAFAIPPRTLPSAPSSRPREAAPMRTRITSLDGPWQLALDPANAGKREEWFNRGPVAGARAAKVSGTVDQVFPGAYSGVIWYWTEFTAPPAGPDDRIVLRFGAADYLAEVWLNGTPAGLHEGGDTPFFADVTQAVRGDGPQRLVVRVLNPGNQPIDGITKMNSPQGYKNYGFQSWGWNPGGLWQPVDLLRVPAVRVRDIFADARWPAGTIACQISLLNDCDATRPAVVRVEAAPACGGPTVATEARRVDLPPGASAVHLDLAVPGARAWSLDDPYLYRVVVRVESAAGMHDEAVRCGFREFVFRDGYFRLNGRRIWIKSCHNSQHYPIGQHIPADPEMLRREIVNLKAMGFNTVRLPFRSMHPAQLDLCDELGLIVYEEHYGSWLMDYSPQHNERFDRSVVETILRDRNHPSLAMRGLLNETPDGPRFRHAVDTLPMVRMFDPHRLILLSSGRWDPNPAIGSLSNPGSTEWECLLGGEQSAEETKTAKVPPGMPGDLHHYCPRPTPPGSIQFLRTVGTGGKNVFLSEFGHGNQMDLVELLRQCEQCRADPECMDPKLLRRLAATFEADFKRWGVDQVYPTTSDLVKEAERIGAELRGEDIDLVRSNPKIAGYSITAWTDEGYESQGIATIFREPKQGMFDVFRDRFAPVHWCLFAGPTHVYPGAKVTIEAVLVNEDVLRPGTYPVRLRVLGPAGVVCEKTATIAILDPAMRPQPPLVTPAFKETLVMGGPPGRYEIAVLFDRGAVARGRRTIFVGDSQSLPKPPGAITIGEKGRALADWLTARGARVEPLDVSRPPTRREIILLGGPEPLGPAETYRAIWTRVARGSSVVVLNPNLLVDLRRQAGRSQRELDFLPTPEKIRIGDPPGGWEGHDKVFKRHPIFDGLPAGCLMDLTFYRDLTPLEWFAIPERLDAQAEMIAPCFILKGNYAAGAVVMGLPFGEGKILLSSLLLAENLGRHPAADRLVLNLLRYAARDQDKPLGALSPSPVLSVNW